MAFEATKKEWCELYSFFRLLADGKVVLGTAEAKAGDTFWPVAMIQREEHDGTRQYYIEEDTIRIEGENGSKSMPREDFGIVADLILQAVKSSSENDVVSPDGYAMVDGLRYSLAETDLFDDMMETGFQQTHNISVGGGTKDISYRFSFGMVNENGVLASDKDTYKRYNVSSYLRSDVFSWITPELDIKYTNSNSSLPETSGQIACHSFQPSLCVLLLCVSPLKLSNGGQKINHNCSELHRRNWNCTLKYKDS